MPERTTKNMMKNLMWEKNESTESTMKESLMYSRYRHIRHTEMERSGGGGQADRKTCKQVDGQRHKFIVQRGGETDRHTNKYLQRGLGRKDRIKAIHFLRQM